MAQGYYTLEEAAQILGMTPDNLKQFARKGEIRSFQDRGTWRFRVQDIQEMARERGLGSDTDLVLGEAIKPQPTDSPAPRHPAKTMEGDVFTVLGEHKPGSDEVIMVDLPSPTKKPTGGKEVTRPPSEKEGSDSDVRLVAEGSGINFALDEADEAKMVDTPTPPKSPRPPGSKGSKTGMAKLVSGPKSPRPESGRHPGEVTSEPAAGEPGKPEVDSDSDVKLVDAGPADSAVALGKTPAKALTDSDIRLDVSKAPAKSDEALLTDEIDLDADLLKDDKSTQKPQVKSRVKPQPAKPEPTAKSPFELSDSGVSPTRPEGDPTMPDSSSDFELTPVGESQSPLELGSSDEFELALPGDADVEIGQEPLGLKSKDSGINLRNPVDSGISLESTSAVSDSIEFELGLDQPHVTPKPAPKEPEIDSDSEFELTLDDSGGLAPLDSDSGSSPMEKVAAEKDIFETDFEVPALEDDSGSEALALDETSSDFDLALEPDDISIDEESGSQVVAVDEGEAEEGASTVARPSKSGGRSGRRAAKAGVADLEAEDDLGNLFDDADEPGVEPGVVGAEAGPYREVAVEALPAPWGVLPVAVLLPCVLVLFLVGLMGFELVQNSGGYRPTGMFTKIIGEPIANMFGVNFRKT
jgi:excisionase family DNA binding protein